MERILGWLIKDIPALRPRHPEIGAFVGHPTKIQPPSVIEKEKRRSI